MFGSRVKLEVSKLLEATRGDESHQRALSPSKGQRTFC
jgi:hypothetical protein